MISFYLKAVPGPKETLRVLQFFCFKSPELITNGAGIIQHKIHIEGLVDQEIKKVHAKAYEEFNALVEKNADCLYTWCRENPGLPLNVEEFLSKKEDCSIEGEKEPIVEEKTIDLMGEELLT